MRNLSYLICGLILMSCSFNEYTKVHNPQEHIRLFLTDTNTEKQVVVVGNEFVMPVKSLVISEEDDVEIYIEMIDCEYCEYCKTEKISFDLELLFFDKRLSVKKLPFVYAFKVPNVDRGDYPFIMRGSCEVGDGKCSCQLQEIRMIVK